MSFGNFGEDALGLGAGIFFLYGSEKNFLLCERILPAWEKFPDKFCIAKKILKNFSRKNSYENQILSNKKNSAEASTFRRSPRS
ncbi:MAG: hypothetical protein ABSG49_07610 [Methanoregula sp.]|jgi:hypothetical protein|uniref:hypothetical protein n=1 Tax=Methanoregula sp. TaxID=2052170 RepID=UPI003C1B913E